MASLRDWLRERLPKGKTPQSKPTVDEDVDMDADDESSGSSPSLKANIGDIPALVKQVVTEVLAEQAKGNHPDNPSQNRKGKNRHSLKPGSTAYNRKVKRNALALLSREQEQKWRVRCVAVLTFKLLTFSFI